MTEKTVSTMTDWEVLCAVLHHSGSLTTALTERVVRRAYVLCDGFGSLSDAELSAINGGWDWSHVRDSSSEAIRGSAAYLRGHLRAQGIN